MRARNVIVLATALLAINIVSGLTVQTSISVKNATCGGCFCVPENDGLGPCPDWLPQTEFSADLIAAFKAKTLSNPFDDLDCNPYTNSTCQTSPPQKMVGQKDAGCAFKYSDATCGVYRMVTYESETTAQADGAFVSHLGACGLCSTAQDLAVYLAHPDMTSAGKKCATKALVSARWGKKCYEALGYTAPCASIWNFDGIFDGQHCAWTCVKALRAANNGPPPACALNACLQCDEDEAGPSSRPSRRARGGAAAWRRRSCAGARSLRASATTPARRPPAASGSGRENKRGGSEFSGWRRSETPSSSSMGTI